MERAGASGKPGGKRDGAVRMWREGGEHAVGHRAWLLVTCDNSSTSANTIEAYCAGDMNLRQRSKHHLTGAGMPTKIILPRVLQG